MVMKLHMRYLQKCSEDFNFRQKIVSENKTIQKFYNTVHIKLCLEAPKLLASFMPGFMKGEL